MTCPSTALESSMDTDEPEVAVSPTMSQEMNLLEIDDVIVHPPRVITKPWKKWTEDDKANLTTCLNYHMDCIEYINTCWARGPTNKSAPKNPDIDIEKLTKKKNVKRRLNLYL